MAKATRVHSTARKTASKKQKRAPENRPRKGLAFINAAYQRKTAAEPDLKRELKMRRHPNDVWDLAALYDAYGAAAEAFQAVRNQPRAVGVEDVIDAEMDYMFAKAWTVAEHLKGLRPTRDGQESFLRALLDCAFDMGASSEEAASVFRDAMNVGVADDRDRHDAARKT